MSLEAIFANVDIPYTISDDGHYCMRAKRCMRQVRKSEDPEKDILSYILSNKGCNVSSLCRHTGCSRDQVKAIARRLIDQGRIRGEKKGTGRHPSVLIYFPN